MQLESINPDNKMGWDDGGLQAVEEITNGHWAVRGLDLSFEGESFGWTACFLLDL